MVRRMRAPNQKITEVKRDSQSLAQTELLWVTHLTPPCSLTISWRIVHKLIADPVTPLPQLVFKNALPKPCGIFRLFRV